jgi:hypothetical protein
MLSGSTLELPLLPGSLDAAGAAVPVAVGADVGGSEDGGAVLFPDPISVLGAVYRGVPGAGLLCLLAR